VPQNFSFSSAIESNYTSSGVGKLRKIVENVQKIQNGWIDVFAGTTEHRKLMKLL